MTQPSTRTIVKVAIALFALFLGIYYWPAAAQFLGLLLASVFSIPNFMAAFDVSFSAGAFLASLIMLLAYNVPTLVFSLMLVFQRHRLSRMRQLNAMRVQDL